MGEEINNTSEKQETLADILAKPLSEAEARRMLADNDVQLAQMRALRIQRTLELGHLDSQIAAAEFDRAVICRRTLNAPEGN